MLEKVRYQVNPSCWLNKHSCLYIHWHAPCWLNPKPTPNPCCQPEHPTEWSMISGSPISNVCSNKRANALSGQGGLVLPAAQPPPHPLGQDTLNHTILLRQTLPTRLFVLTSDYAPSSSCNIVPVYLCQGEALLLLITHDHNALSIRDVQPFLTEVTRDNSPFT